ncbi:odorant receptor 67a isoform X2 [Cimex lectularius]|uniref:Odorant receptor n=1 Tax=Cimex lectularius TaxID=79782 RepID=A0A8I6S697_CIMLE|nr:odorant receptor 67a isoform X2 [Cimex lectularius]
MKSECMKFTRLLLQISGFIPINNSYGYSFSFKLISLNGKVAMLVYSFISFMFVVQSDLTESFLAMTIFCMSVQLVLKAYMTSKNNFFKMLDEADQLLENVLTDQKAPLKNPYQLWSPFSSVLLSYFFQSYILLMAGIIETSYLDSIASVSLHITGCLKILSHRLSNQSMFVSKKVERESIKIHSDVIRLVASMNKNYGAMLTIEILFASVQACLAGYQIMVGLENLHSNLLVFFITFIFVWLLPSMICFCGQEIETESENIHRLLHYNSWFQRSPENRKTVFFQMLMMSKPLKLHFRNFIVFNVAQLAGVLQSAYTVMTMMRLFFN